MIWHGVCSACGESVTGGTTNDTLDLPVGGQKVVCLACLCLVGTGEGVEAAFSEMGIPYLIKKELAEA